ncbi:MAG: hypothetical protein HYT09_03215 [Candidatus Levybacteria bacterium]|nr:hypothetical protein [Candidatus Levybacteria bacterium]MBI4098028.1 hypothetical protein [Candidatus Levybacteria bacterium]
MGNEQKPNLEKPSDFTPYADILDVANAEIETAAEVGDSGAVFRAMEAKRRATEEWFPRLKEADPEV